MTTADEAQRVRRGPGRAWPACDPTAGRCWRSRRSSSSSCSSWCRSSSMSVRSVTDPAGRGPVELRSSSSRGGVRPRPDEHVLDRGPVDRRLPRARLSVRVPDVHRARPLGRAAAHRGPAAVLVEPAGPHLRLAGAAARHRHHQPVPAGPRRDLRAAHADPHHGRRDHRDVAHPAAVHGAADLRGDAADRPGVRAGRGQPRRVAGGGVRARVRAAEPARRAGGLPAGVRPRARLLHHAGAAGRAHGPDDQPDHRPADPAAARLGIRDAR